VILRPLAFLSFLFLFFFLLFLRFFFGKRRVKPAGGQGRMSVLAD